MSRLFTAASSENITLSLGGMGFVFGPGTAAAIIRPTSVVSSNPTILSAGATNAVSWMLQLLTTTGTLAIRLDGGEVHSSTAVGMNVWTFVCATKATGTVTPRMHLYPYATGTWVHENASGTRANSSTPLTRAQIGCTPAVAAFFQGDVAVCGAWDVEFTDSQVEALAFSLIPWFTHQPKGLFVLDQAAVGMSVPDLSGGGANQSAITGTTVSANSVPVFSYGHLMAGAA
jgi:hypothetical protein